jgi:hypothetical protein
VTNNWPFADPTAVSDRFTILIATIDQDDANHTYTRAVARAFLNRNGVERIETCRVLRLSSVGREAGIKAVNTARAWLRQRHADLLIGGELLKKDEAVNLWFIGDSSAQSFQATPFRLDANLLKEDFKQAASTQILGVALAAVKAVTEESGKYLAGILKPVTERLRHLLDDAAGLSKEQHAQLQYALGLGLFVVGDQSADKKALDDAATAFRAALTGWTRERVPYYWAQVQENLTIVFGDLATRTPDDTRRT